VQHYQFPLLVSGRSKPPRTVHSGCNPAKKKKKQANARDQPCGFHKRQRTATARFIQASAPSAPGTKRKRNKSYSRAINHFEGLW